jgi:hypothetical protein
MYPNLIQTLGAERIREWHEEAARDRLMKEARRARRAARQEAAGRPGSGSRWPARRIAATAEVPDDPRAVLDDRQPAGSRAA